MELIVVWALAVVLPAVAAYLQAKARAEVIRARAELRRAGQGPTPEKMVKEAAAAKRGKRRGRRSG
ncbi:hypothetical protein [Yinghuangia sp. YIM S09857]|uniref:hypothetical protein n=1 Tax=Yinghuangia sp. YIM S09857 TaxID=3436929 RepID=UPI003F53BF61